MKFTFDYYKQLHDPEFYLCNPDGKQIAVLSALNRALTLRFNDLSELAFEVPSRGNGVNGEIINFDYYDRVESKRLVYVTSVGWFQITEVNEIDNGDYKSKSVSCESLQTVFKNKGFFKEGRLYKFYNPEDPTDETYDTTKADAIPSIVGQLYQQLGIQIGLQISDIEPVEDYEQWTITYIEPALRYEILGENNVCRTFTKDETTYGYDFMVNDVENAFEVIFIFDFCHHAIKIKSVESVTEKTDIYLSFDNVLRELTTTEKADEIVTVLSCKGNNLDIRSVNPTGTNYIVDFSYYMDEVNYHWMSKELIDQLKIWQDAVKNKEDDYSKLVLQLQSQYLNKASFKANKVYVSQKTKDLDNIRDSFITDNTTGGNIFVSETVKEGEYSLDEISTFNKNIFSGGLRFTCHADPPIFANNRFTFNDEGVLDSFQGNYEKGNLYFVDEDLASYCKLISVVKIENNVAVYYVSGFERYSKYDSVSTWISNYEKKLESLNNKIELVDKSAEETTKKMAAISENLNILNHFSKNSNLLRELEGYWIEGEYQNDNLAVLDSTTLAESIDLSKELMALGKKELIKVSQPKFSFTVNPINFLKMYEFQEFTYEIELGKLITIEKCGGLHYYPALTQMSFGLDDDTFELTFSNALKPTDGIFTIADLITTSANTSRTVTSNWQEIIDFSKNKDSIKELLYNPLDRSLRLAQSNGINQQFIVDDQGILGRKYQSINKSSFEDEQIRIINNVILFTDNSWRTAKTALGKINYTENGVHKSAYGLLAEVLVGSLIMGNTLKITNESNSIVLDGQGIVIKDNSNNIVFRAHSTGDVFIKGAFSSANGSFEVNSEGYLKATGGTIGGYVIGENSLISGTVGLSSSTNSGAYSFWAGNTNASSAPFSVTREGNVVATKGEIGGLTLGDGNLYSNNFSIETQKDSTKSKSSLRFFNDQGIVTTSISDTDIYANLITGKSIASTSMSASTLNIGEVSLSGSYLRGRACYIKMNEGGDSKRFTATLSFNGFNRVIKVSISEPIWYTRVFYVSYHKLASSTLTTSITVNAGSSEAQVTVDAFWGIEDVKFVDTSTSSYSFTQATSSENILIHGNLIPSGDNQFSIGNTSRKWKNVRVDNVYSLSGEINASDINKKNTVNQISNVYSELFDRLSPVTYKYNDGDSNRTHIGLIANDVKNSLDELKISTNDFAAYCSWNEGDEETSGIRYGELVSLNIFEIQKLKSRVKDLENELKVLKGDSSEII